jgi:hypothetical protein
MSPLIFGLMGNNLDIINQVHHVPLRGKTVQVPISSLGQSLLVVVIGSIMRMLGGFVSVLGLGSGLNWRESVFVAITWLPKTAPTAALAPLYLELGRTFGGEREVEIGITVRSICLRGRCICMNGMCTFIADGEHGHSGYFTQCAHRCRSHQSYC